ncbi:MAG: SDR family NAD(P)-dependent oxidoreductase [Parabacteroides sp.]|nr:SDR family NAD(P)-dependent oxidoreductase [Parabacteroides sp.]
MKYALITGATSGIGLEYTRQLAKQGWNIILVSNQVKENRLLMEDIYAEYGVETIPLTVDLSEEDSAQWVYERCQQMNVEVEILISNAGILHFGNLINAKADMIDRIITLHCTTPAKLCNLFAVDMCRRRSGHILLMSSMSAWIPYPTMSLYGSTKVFLKNFGQSLWYELRRYGVSVTTVLPGAVDTPLYKLDDKKRKLLRSIGVMTSAQTLARNALQAMFRRKRQYIPGFLTKVEVLLCRLLPAHGLLPVLKIPAVKRILDRV